MKSLKTILIKKLTILISSRPTTASREPENENLQDKWVYNLYSKPLTIAEILSPKRPKICCLHIFHPYIWQYHCHQAHLWILGSKQALGKTDCTKYHAIVKNALSRTVAKPKPIHPNITKEERKALPLFTKDDSCTILTADKGVTLVIMDKDMYIKKCMALLNDEEVYKECREQTISMHSKVVKHCFSLKIFN